MNVDLSHKETATLIAALNAWTDPVGYLASEDGTFVRYRQHPLNDKELKTLLGRLKFAMNKAAGERD